MQVSHRTSAASVSFDEPNLVSVAGLVPVMTLARDAGLHELADEWLSLPTDKGANAGLKVASLVAGMVAGADSIDDMALLRHGGMKRLFTACYAPSTLGSFLRSFTFGHVRQLDAVASRFLANLAARAPLLGSPGTEDFVFVDVDDTIIEVHGYAKQGSGYGYSGVRGLNALLATASTKDTAPVILAQRLRKGAANSARGSKRLITDALSTLTRTHAGGQVLVRADSAFYGHRSVSAALAGRAEVSVTVRMDPAVKRAIATIPETAWTTIEYTDAVFDENTNTWVSRAEVAEVPFTAFSSRKTTEQITGRLSVARRGRHRLQPHPRRRIPRRRSLQQRQDRNDPPQTHPHPRQDRPQRAENTAPPPRSLALANTLGKAGHQRPPTACRSVTIPSTKPGNGSTRTPVEHHRQEGRRLPRAQHRDRRRFPECSTTKSGSVDQGLVAGRSGADSGSGGR
ncbi:hypothetical protein IWX65_002645 [Arthrobacter sp. CAN_A214]